MFQKIVKGGTAVLVRQLVSFPMNLIGLTLTSRLLTPDDFALNAILIPAVNFSFMAIDWGTSQALVQSNSPASAKLTQRIFFQKLLMGLAIITVLFFASSRLALYLDVPRALILLFPVAGLIGWLQSQRAYQAVYLQRQVDWSALTRVELIEIGVYNATLIISAYFFRSAWAFALAMAVRAFVGTVLLRLSTVQETIVQSHTEETTVHMKPLLKFGVPMQFATFLTILNGLANPVIVGSLLGSHSVGLINWSNNIVSVPRTPVRPFPLFLFSVLSERRRRGQSDKELLSSLAFFSAVMIAGISLLVILSMDFLVQYVFGSQWEEAIPLVSIMMLGNVVFIQSMLVRAQVQAAGYSTLWLITNIVGTSIIWIAGYFVTKSYGTTGFAIVGVLAGLISFAVIVYFARTRLQLYIPLLDSIYLILAIVVATIFSYYLNNLAASSFSDEVSYFITFAGGIMLFIVALLPLIFIRRDKLELLLDTFRTGRGRFSDGFSEG